MLLTASLYAIAFVGGLALFAAPFTRSGRAGPQWIRIALGISGWTGLAWSILGFTLLVGSGSLSERSYGLLVHFKTLFAGMAIGILILMFASGEFAKFF